MNADTYEYQPRIFPCKQCGWIIGESYREPNSRITQLRIYRHARTIEQGADLRPLAAHIKFSALRVNDGAALCEHCGAEIGWFANQNAIAEMLDRKSIRRMEAVPNG